MRAIADKKQLLKKDFDLSHRQQVSYASRELDGIYTSTLTRNGDSKNEPPMLRKFVQLQKEQYFQSNGEMVGETQFFNEHLSKLSNISFRPNYALKITQKNALLSERSNQSKGTAFQLELVLDQLLLTSHQLHNREEMLFSELLTLFAAYESIALYPSLPQLDKQLKFLTDQQQSFIDSNDAIEREQLSAITKKIEGTKISYEKESQKLNQLFHRIYDCWRAIKDARREQGFDSVPWKVQFKRFEANGKRLLDVGLVSFDLGDRPTGAPQAIEAEEARRRAIRSERYFVRVLINRNVVAESDKFQLQWPSYRVPLQESLRMTIYSLVSDFRVQIFRVGFIDQLIDEVQLELPGSCSSTVFSSEKKLVESSFALNRYKNAQNSSNQTNRPITSSPRTLQGHVTYSVQWCGEGTNLLPEQSEKSLNLSDDRSTDISQDELMDAMDPRVSHRKNKQIERMKMVRDVEKERLLPFSDVQPSRLLLLKLRAQTGGFEKLQIPLTEEAVRLRQDLMTIISQEEEKGNPKRGILEQLGSQNVFNPLEGIFKEQDSETIQETQAIFKKVQEYKVNAGRGISAANWKVSTEEIISEFMFEQMESPIVLFFRNLFTQKRKLGPQVTYRPQTRTKIDELEINLHLRSASGLPIRESSFGRIREFQQEQNRLAQPQGAMDVYAAYGMGMFRQQPTVNMHNHTFFTAGMQNYNQSRNQQVSYPNKSLDRLNGFVEARFRKAVKRTLSLEGPFPQWNETITLNYRVGQNSFESLFIGGEAPIKLFVFDITEQSEPTQAIMKATIKKTKFYLGRVQIPFSYIIAMPATTGVFKVDRPLVIFGYSIKRTGLFEQEQDTESASKTEKPDALVYLNIDLFTEPMIDNTAAYHLDRKLAAGGKNPLLLQRAADWLESTGSKRYARLWLNHVEDKNTFISLFINGSRGIVTPPQLESNILENGENSSIGAQNSANLIERCARFVSLLPRKTQCRLLDNTEQFHLKVDEFLHMKMGQDHGILLCNYFNYIDSTAQRTYVQSYLLPVKAFPYGKAIFVLRRDSRTNNCQIWDPYTGDCFYFPAKQYQTYCCCLKYERKAQISSQRNICPIIELSCVVSFDNVYISAQQSLKPQGLDFNLEDESLWKPFLSPINLEELFQSGTMKSVQPELSRDFYPQLARISRRLEVDLFEFLRNKIESQRRNHFRPYRFRLNTDICTKVRPLLDRCELFKSTFRTAGLDSQLYADAQPELKRRYVEAVQELEKEKNRIKSQIDSDRTLFGFPLNLTYTTHQQMWQRLAQTQVHLDEHEDIQFVLAVRVFQYPCYIMSVWLFIGMIS